MPGVSEKQSAVSRFPYFHKTDEREDLRYAFALIYLMTGKKTQQKSRGEESCAFATVPPAIYHRKKGSRRGEMKKFE